MTGQYKITESDIRKIVASNRNYALKNSYLSEDIFIQLIIDWNEKKDAMFFYAKFGGWYKCTDTVITIYSNGKIEADCNCMYCSSDIKCAHVAAVLSYYLTIQDHLQLPFIKNIERIDEDCFDWEEYYPVSNELRLVFDNQKEMIEKFQLEQSFEATRRRINEKKTVLLSQKSRGSGNISIQLTINEIPKSRFSNYNMLCCVNMKIGNERMYVVKNIRDFILRLRENEYYSYGKQLAFVHDLFCFDNDGIKIIEMFEKLIKNGQFLLSNDNRDFYINDANIHTFYQCLKRLENPKIHGLVLEDFEFKINVTIEEKDDHNHNYFRLFIKQDEKGLVQGNDGFYKLKGNKLTHYAFPKNQNISDLLEQLEEGTIIEKKDMPTYVQLFIEPAKEVLMMKGADITSYYQEKMEVSFYTDLTSAMEISILPVIESKGVKKYLFNPDLTDKDLRMQLLENQLRDRVDEVDSIRFEGIIKEKNVMEFVRTGFDWLKSLGNVFISARLKRISDKQKVSLQVGVRIESELLKVHFSTENIDVEELKQILKAYRNKKQYYLLKDGGMVDFSENSEMKEIDRLDRQLYLDGCLYRDGEYILGQAQALRLQSIPEQFETIALKRQESFEDLIHRFGNDQTHGVLPERFNGILRDYQKAGYYWLKKLEKLGLNGILADDMGLGKTLQVIALLESSQSQDRHSLVVCPSSLLLNWEAEVHKFASSLKCQVILGNAADRAEKIQNIEQFDLSIITYDALKRDIELFEQKQLYYVILDEAQYIKNQRTKNASSVKKLHTQHRLALTGTPIENTLAELWSIFDFLMPNFLFNYHYFQKNYERPIVIEKDEDVARELKGLVEPFILRRTKKEVLTELPDKIESLYTIEFNEEEWKIYLANLMTVEKDVRKQLKDEKIDRFMVLAMLTKLRQLCCEPALVYEEFESPGSKMQACLELIEGLATSGKKLLLFSSFTTILDRLQEELTKLGIKSYTLQGSTPKEERQRLVTQFQLDDTPVFLISLKAGGTGLNLTAAEAVIHYDPWWNLSAQNQATDRAHRIGQDKSVTVYSLIMKNSIEEKIMKLQQEKKNLADAFVENSHGSIAGMNADQMMDLFALPENKG